MQHIRHGDVLLEKVDSVPSSAKPISHQGEYVLAWGEITGHAHRVKSSKDTMQVFSADNVVYMTLTIPAPLTHEEHKRIEIPCGTWRVGFEREFDYAMEEITKVQD